MGKEKNQIKIVDELDDEDIARISKIFYNNNYNERQKVYGNKLTLNHI